MADTFNPNSVDLDTDDASAITQIYCYLQRGGNDYNGNLGARISSLFVILVVSSAVTFFPVVATRVKWVRVPLWVYLFARYFGAGVIIATAFIHLLDPAYTEIGPYTCVGMTPGWDQYSWVPAIALTSVMVIFLMDFGAERYVEVKYGFHHSHPDAEAIITSGAGSNHQYLHSADQGDLVPSPTHRASVAAVAWDASAESFGRKNDLTVVEEKAMEDAIDRSFRTQIAAFLILEFGVIFHSVIIGLNLGSAGDEFSTLYPVLVFHQSFEGLGIGARLSAIPFPKAYRWMPWALCAAYGLTTPIAIAAGLGVRTTYDAGSFTANVVSGVLDSISAGILIYTGLVELLARDFLFNPERTRDNKRLTFMIVCLFLGAALMALLGKWA